MNIPEGVRRVVASVAQVGGWLAAMGVGTFATINYDPASHQLAPQWVSMTFIACVGIALAGTAARSRMRLGDTLEQVLRLGNETSAQNRQRIENVERRIDEGDE